MYLLRGAVNAGPGAWATVGSGNWPVYWDLSNNDCLFGGSITATYDLIAYSDIRHKTNLLRIEDALDKVSALNGYTYNRIDHEDQTVRHVGVVAQEVLAVLPEAVHTTDKGMYAVAYGNMVALLIEAIKEERKKREDLEVRLERLEKLLEQK
jgi:hypothetical protein